jgi:2-oxoglutarate dehydrogenase E1 component
MTDLKQFSGPNAGYLIELYESYLRDPDLVSGEMRQFLETLDIREIGIKAPARAPEAADAGRVLSLVALVQAIREKGHLCASFDPLGLREPETGPTEPQSYGLSDSDLGQMPASLIESRVSQDAASAGEVVSRLRSIYCGSAGYEFAHIRSEEERRWLQEAVESGRLAARLGKESRRNVLERLTNVEVFEQFLHRSFPGQKWFSLEGCDVLVPVLDEIIWESAHDDELRVLTMGMAHRGRLNVLTHVLGKSYEDILAEFAEGHHAHGSNWDGSEPGSMLDVKYHMGARRKIPSEKAGDLSLVLMSNPSHLEMVTPVAQGAARAYQEQNDFGGPPWPDEDAALPVVMHGDAAFTGQGIVAESLNMALLEGYRTGGTIHIVVNNQVGFTTEPHEFQSALYSTDVARGYDIPIVHVNADDVVACLSAARLAFAYRQQFHKDFLIDLVGYRRYGHNEGDEPSFTQPAMYRAIEQHPTARAIWARQLVSEGVVSEDDVEAMVHEVTTALRQAFITIPKSRLRELPEIIVRAGNGIPVDEEDTAVAAETLERLNEELHRVPEGFALNSKLERPFQRRREALEALKDDGRIDWAHAEALAFASILAEGTPVRLTGQDTERGTFSQRHAVLHDTNNGQRFVPLQAMSSARASFSVYDSPLSEAGALGYEYGYSAHAPDRLVLWEAQFGDFINNAQGIVDEFIVSAQTKWGQSAGLVLLLPHGYEGQGPDHSNAYLERFLQSCADDNIQVVYPTTAAQYFHLLRRQARLLRTAPNPLIVMTPKSLLRHPLASSTLAELAQGRFQQVIDDQGMRESAESVRRVILCTGKVFVDLVTSGEFARAEDVAVVRVEQLYPFPHDLLASVLKRYRSACEAMWLQEEPRNRGAWSYISPLIGDLLGPNVPLLYAGRPNLPSPAEGHMAQHRVQQEQIIQDALAGKGGMAASSRAGGLRR